MGTSLKRSFGLDLVRACAIVLVLLSHFVSNFEVLGFWGVEIFFALSGFLIGHILWRNYSKLERWNFSQIINFWSRRWWRTLPNYYLFFIIMLFYHFIKDGSLPSTMKLLNFLWFGQYLLDHEWGFFGVSWSLCVEEWFYLLFPIVLYVFSKIQNKPNFSFTATLIFFFLGSLIIKQFLIQDGKGDSLRTITFSRLDSIAFGVAIAYITSIIKFNTTKYLAALIVGLLLLLSPIISVFVYHLTKDELMQSPFYLVVLPIGASLILPFMNLLPRPQGFFEIFSSWVEKLSMWSYSIYLTHIPIMWTTYYLMSNLKTNIYGIILSKVVGLFLTISVSGLIFKYFESPILLKRPAPISLKKVKEKSFELTD